MTYISPKKQRCSAEAAYLTPSVLQRKNLKVATHAHVSRVLIDEVEGKKRAVGVEWFSGKQKGDMKVWRTKARNEVVLS